MTEGNEPVTTDTSTRYKVRQVFVPGGRPTITYVPRGDLRLETEVIDYLESRHKILSVSGPTKTGKTVLLRSQVNDDFEPIWLSGGAITTVEDFWSTIADELELPTEFGMDGGLSHTQSGKISGELSGGFIKGGGDKGSSVTRDRKMTERTTVSPKRASRKKLQEDPNRVIVVDDFHYVPSDVQVEIVRGMKDLVFDGVGLIVAAVPHRAYDVVKVEKEMTGRVAQLEVGFWSEDDLKKIAKRGFAALNLVVNDALVTRLVHEAFQSPHLMQEFCRQLCADNAITETSDAPVGIGEPDWDAFFKRLAPGASKAAFDLLARGPRQRSDRKVRHLREGQETDIYGAVLRAIAYTGPLTELTYEQLRAALRAVLAASDEPPQKHEVTRVLDEMTRIAREQIDGEPVVDYDGELATLYISDPYFAYWLRWGTRVTGGGEAG
ncbi:hypothetical protein [Mycobacterium sp. 852013-50091_SCH5140682]|uniref:hypothetical protein n=1 Tax=Mycobacterium sp. 852013-50091_SCH5140682 TaxID=1834109 RepID=UPI0012EA4E2B|nr:hypothetical protein [Mycobacterium sp. 852013-50091_SCH5140682]